MPTQRKQAIRVGDGTLVSTTLLERATVAVIHEAHEPVLICSGLRIAQGVVLTAAHCVRDVEVAKLSVRHFEQQVAALHAAEDMNDSCSSAGVVPASIPVLGASVHPELDLAVLRIEEEPGFQTVIRATNQLEVGDEAMIAGFGVTESRDLGALRAIEVDVLENTGEVISVQARGGGACAGDSGGPLYIESSEEVVLFGALSQGSASCTGRDEYVSIPYANAWLDSFVPN